MQNLFSFSIDIYPIKEDSNIATKAFLQKVIDVCMQFIVESNDRSEPIVRFNDPEELKHKFDFEIGCEPRNLELIVNDCASALYYQVRTGKFFFVRASSRATISLHAKITKKNCRISLPINFLLH